jgi:hypothetical protein
VADADFVDVATQDGVHPDAGVLAADDIANQLGGFVDVAGRWNLGRDAFEGADHGPEFQKYHE